jgi:hypothetical protein
VEEAVDALKSVGRLQPSLFWVQIKYLIKADNSVIPLSGASCFTEDVEATFMSFFGIWNGVS